MRPTADDDAVNLYRVDLQSGRATPASDTPAIGTQDVVALAAAGTVEDDRSGPERLGRGLQHAVGGAAALAGPARVRERRRGGVGVATVEVAGRRAGTATAHDLRPCGACRPRHPPVRGRARRDPAARQPAHRTGGHGDRHGGQRRDAAARDPHALRGHPRGGVTASSPAVIPLKDSVPTERTPWLTIILIALNVVAYFVLQSGGILSGPSDTSVIEYGAIPYEITHPGEHCQASGESLVCGEGAADQPPTWLTVLTSMFMHGSILHLAGNMLFLWIFGNNIEDSMSKVRFVVFYLLGGVAALALQTVVEPNAAVPTIGASGAIAAVLGGYLVRYPNARIITAIFIVFFFTVVELPALLVLASGSSSRSLRLPRVGCARRWRRGRRLLRAHRRLRVRHGRDRPVRPAPLPGRRRAGRRRADEVRRAVLRPALPARRRLRRAGRRAPDRRTRDDVGRGPARRGLRAARRRLPARVDRRTDPKAYGAWKEHLVAEGADVIAPVYQRPPFDDVRTPLPNVIAAVRAGLRRLPGHGPLLAAGHSAGGALSADLAASARAAGLPPVSAVYAVYPGRRPRAAGLPRRAVARPHPGRARGCSCSSPRPMSWWEPRPRVRSSPARPARGASCATIRDLVLGAHNAPLLDGEGMRATFWSPLDGLLRDTEAPDRWSTPNCGSLRSPSTHEARRRDHGRQPRRRLHGHGQGGGPGHRLPDVRAAGRAGRQSRERGATAARTRRSCAWCRRTSAARTSTWSAGARPRPRA